MYLNFIFSRGTLSLKKIYLFYPQQQKEYTMIPIILLAETYQFTILNSYQLSYNQIYAWIFNYWGNRIQETAYLFIFF